MSEIIIMSCNNKKLSLSEIADIVRTKLEAEVVWDERQLDNRAIMLCFEDYYFRSGGYVSLSVMLIDNDNCQEAVVVGSGGGAGLENISLGANKSFAKRAKKILLDYGFEVKGEMKR